MLKMQVQTYATSAIALVVMALAAPASAQEAAPATTQDAAPVQPDTQLGDIIVTAQKRSESVQKVPISIVALSGAALQAGGIRSVLDLPQAVPNLQANKGPTTASVRLSVRGLGAYGNSAVEPSVGTFVDGVYIPRPGSLFGSFLDISGAEVLRGPQGTLFGRNTTVGALNLTTVAPTSTFGGEAAVEGGTGERYKGTASVNVPLGENVSARLAGMVERFGGFYHNDATGQRVGGVNTLAFRGTVRANLSDSLTWTVRGDYAKLTGDGSVLFEILPQTLTPAGKARLDSLLGAGNYDLKPFDFRGRQRLHSGLFDRNWGVSSTLDYEFGDGFTVRAINSIRGWKNRQADGDLSWTNLALLNRDGAYNSDSTSHELQLISPKDLLDGRLDFVGGLFYFREKYKIDFVENMGLDYCTVAVALANTARCLANPLNGAGEYILKQTADSYAAYGQITYRVVPSLAFTAGGRYTQDDKSGSFTQLRANPTLSIRAPENTDLDYGQGKFTYRLNLAWTPMRDALVYATYSTGYKSGGFNAGAGGVALTSTQRTFGAETVKDYEVGLKTQLFDRHVTFNFNLYRLDVDGYQDRQIDSNAAVIVRNVGSLRQQGFESELTVRPDRRLTLNGAVAYLDSKFLNYRGAPGLPGFGGVQDITGKPANNSPKWSGVVGGEWKDRLGSTGLTWSLRGGLSFTSSANLGQVTDGNPDTIQKGYSLVDARLALNGPDDLWTLSIFGNNLADKGYCALSVYQIFDGPLGLRNALNGSTLVRCIAGAPRTIGASFSHRF
jgi:iron complex outermembrane receptor protein